MGKLYQSNNSKIISKKQISENYFLITFLAEKIARISMPGQFVMIKIDNEKTFLRRPFSICDVHKKTFDIVFKVVGIGTEILSQKKIGDVVNIIGPLGAGYPRLPKFASADGGQRLPILVAGGTGVASLLFLAKRFRLHDSHFTIFIGAKAKKDILLEKEFKKLGYKVVVSTEDGSHGCKGLVSEVFSRYLSTLNSSHGDFLRSQLSTVIYACGPKPMLKKVAGICKDKKLKCYVSLEEKMACGIGACMGCVIKVKSDTKCHPEFNSGSHNNKMLKQVQHDTFRVQHDIPCTLHLQPYTSHLTPYTYKRVCKDGPVFDAEEIIWK